MARKLIDIKDAKRGGESTNAKYGSEHYAKIASKGRRTVEARDPDFYKRLAAAGFHARQVKIQAAIAKQLGESLHPSAFDTLVHTLSGKK